MAKIESDKDYNFDFVLKYCPKILESKKNEKRRDIARKITHLYLNGKSIQKIGYLKAFPNLIALYLHENSIKKIENLDFCTHLTHLYLQKNEIRKITGLQNLKNLKKLYLGHNRISVVEGLENLNSLIELHLEKQKLEQSDGLCFDPRSLLGIRDSLKILNISDNNIFSLYDIRVLYNLEVLIAKNNRISNLHQTANDIQNLQFLKEISLTGNPITKNLKYKDQLIIKAPQLDIIDGKEIQENTKIFLQNLAKEKAIRAHFKYSDPDPVSEEFLSKCPSGIRSELKKSIGNSNQSQKSNLRQTASSAIVKHPERSIQNARFTPSADTCSTEHKRESAKNTYLPWKRLPVSNPKPKGKESSTQEQNSATLRSIHTINFK